LLEKLGSRQLTGWERIHDERLGREADGRRASIKELDPRLAC
jgi:hypothetical protein